MRSAQPIPGDPWPHEMSITIENRPITLLELLWLREAHGLNVDGGDLPPLLLNTPEAATAQLDPTTRRDWEASWARIWSAAAEHAGREVDHAAMQRLHSSEIGSAERKALLRNVIGPTWGDEFGEEAFDDPAHQAWKQGLMDALLETLGENLAANPERRDLDALVPAWRAGLTKIVTIPCRGEYRRRLGANALLVTDGVRADSRRYRAALRAFA